VRIRSLFHALLCTAIAAGCSPGDGLGIVQRLGPRDLEVREIDREVREVLPSDPAQRLAAQLDASCSVHLGHAHGASEGTLTFSVAFSQGDDSAPSNSYSGSSHGGQGWTDARIAVPPAGATGLILTIAGEGAEGGVWSRPLAVCPASRQRGERRNVILISLDTLRADRLGSYGNPNALTPSLDRIVAGGTLFEHAYAHFPSTLSSHASLFTGQYPSQHRVGMNLLELRRELETLAPAFARQGYTTAAFTENAFVSSDFGFNIGFDSYHNGAATKGRPGEAGRTFARGIEWLERRPDAHFFLFLHTYEVHVPYAPEPEALSTVMENQAAEYSGRFASQCGGLVPIAHNSGRIVLSAADRLQIERLYDAEVVELDRQVGELFRQLERLVLLESTLVVLFSDHGEAFYEHGLMGHGTSLHEEVMRVPLILHLPGVVPGAQRISPRLGLIDLGPTIAELAGIGPVLEQSPGRSRAAWVLGGRIDPAGPVFSELDASPAACAEQEPGQFTICPYDGVSVRDEEYSYIQSRVHDEEFLYAFSSDAAEQRNIAAQLPEVTARYRKLSDDFRARVKSPHLEVERPELHPTTQENLRALGYLE
jgi:arylsulfatase A-like enzyme